MLRALALSAMLLAAGVLGGISSSLVEAQGGPFAAQVQRALRSVGLTSTTSGITEVDGIISPSRFRVDFELPCVRRKFSDYTADTYTDADTNLAYCFGTPFIFYYRIEGTQSGTPVISGGVMDIDNDGADNEGIELVIGDFDNTAQGYYKVGTSTTTKVFKARINIASVSGTDNVYFGWRIAQTFVDDLVLASYDTYGVYHINDAAGNIVIQTGDDTVDGTDEEDQVATWADGEWHILEVRIHTDGTFTFYIDGLQSTQTNATGAGSAGEIFIPVIGMLQATDADTELTIDWMEFGDL